MFTDIDTALRIDTAEARLSKSVATQKPDGFVLPLGKGFAVFAAPGRPTNKAIGMGIDAPLDPAELAAAEEAFRARREPLRFELSTLSKPEVGTLLTERGYRLQGFENVLGLDLRATAPGAVSTHVAVGQSGAAELETYVDTVVDGFFAPDTSGVPGEMLPRALLEEISRDFARSESTIRYLARVDGAAAGAASMRMDDGIAQMCGAATRPQFRRRGVQSALFEQRLADARAAGCDLAVVTTAPGTQSQANAEKRGFRLLYVRAVLVRSL